MAGKKRWVGLASIQYGPVALHSVAVYIPSTLTEITFIKPGTARAFVELPESKKLYTENSAIADLDLPVGENSAQIEFATVDMDQNLLVLAFGGSTSGTVYAFPTTASQIIQRAIIGTTKEIDGTAFQIQIPNAIVRGNVDLPLANNDPEAGEIGFVFAMSQAQTTAGTAVAPFRLVSL